MSVGTRFQAWAEAALTRRAPDQFAAARWLRRRAMDEVCPWASFIYRGVNGPSECPGCATLSANDGCLRETDGCSRREADITDPGLGRLNWADSGRCLGPLTMSGVEVERTWQVHS